MIRVARYVSTKRGIAESLVAAARTDDQMFAETYNQVLTTLETLLSSAASAHLIRDDMSAEELITAMGGLWNIEPDQRWDHRSSRLIDLLMDALRSGPIA